MPRHADKRGPQPFKVDIQHARRLGGVHDQRHPPLTAKPCDLPDRKNEAEDIGDHGAHHKLRLRDFLLKSAEAGFPVKQRGLGDQELRAQLFERARDGVVLIARDQDL